MKKYKLLPLILLCLIFFGTTLAGAVKAQTTPSYVGIKKGDQFTWDMKLNEDGFNSLKQNLGQMKDYLEGNLSSYGNMNFTEAMKAIFTDAIDNSGFLPSGWENMNMTSLFEATIEYYIDNLNNSISSIPSNWQSLNITAFKNALIDGLSLTYPGSTDNIYSFLDLIVDQLTNAGLAILPSNWENLNLLSLYEWEINNFLNNTIYFGRIPNGWENYNYSQFLASMIPGMKSDFVDFIMYLARAPTFITSTSMHDLLFTTLNQSLPAGTLDLTLKDFVDYAIISINQTIIDPYTNQTLGIFPSNYDTCNVSTLFDDIIYGINASIGDNTSQFLKMNISSFIDEFKGLINMSLYNSSMSSYDMSQFIDYMVTGMVQGVNQTLYYLNPNWESLTVNQLIDFMYNQLMIYYDSMVTYLQSSGMFIGIKIQLNITNISPEQTSGGLKYVYVNFSLRWDAGIGQWTRITQDELPYFWPGPLPMAIIDPSTFTDPVKCLAQQANRSMLLFIGKTFDTSKISFKNMTLDLSPFNSLTINMDWNNNGVLSNAEVNYGTANIASIKEVSGVKPPQPPGIPGYGIFTIIGVSIASMLGLIYIANKKRK